MIGEVGGCATQFLTFGKYIPQDLSESYNITFRIHINDYLSIFNYHLGRRPQLVFHLWNICEEIDDTDSHHSHCSSLSHGIAHESHDERKDGAAEESHNHQT